nr:putative E3 ubiquitin-protein ligase RF298 [Ipomoea trifida]
MAEQRNDRKVEANLADQLINGSQLGAAQCELLVDCPQGQYAHCEPLDYGLAGLLSVNLPSATQGSFHFCFYSSGMMVILLCFITKDCNVEQRGGESSQQLAEWDDPMAVEMEQLLIPLIKEASRTAIKRITECGCSEEEAEWAVLTSGVYQGYMDLTNNIVNGAFALLEYTNGFDTSIRPLFDDLESLAGYILLEMVSVMKETKPFLSVGADPQPSQPSHVSGSDKKGGKGSKGKRVAGADPQPKTKIATPVVKTPGNIPASSSDVSEKDAMIVSLMQRKQQLQKEVQGWIDWTNVKVGQATRKLSMDQAELRICDKLCSKLMEGIAESRLNFVDSCIDLHKSKSREEELQKQRRTLEVEMSSLKGELAALKGNSADLQAKIDKARKCQSVFEGLWQREEREKTKLLEKAESIRRERQERKQKTKIEEETLIAKGEENRVKYEEQMNKLSAEISVVKLGAVGESSSSGQGGLKREWECVMCLTEPNSVVFLPCAHQVLWTACNVLHQSQGMKDYPLCRMPIKKRIQARFVPPN